MAVADASNAGPLDDLTGFQRDALTAISGFAPGEPSGQDVLDVLEAAYNREINHGRLYPNLDELVDRGLVRKGEKDRRTNSYALTRRGRRELRAYRDWIDGSLEDA